VLDPAMLTKKTAPTNPPGFRQPGTADWQWHGTLLQQVPCEPLGGPCNLIIAQALPPRKDWNPFTTIDIINGVAKGMLTQMDVADAL
jgi:hypothetical protein